MGSGVNLNWPDILIIAAYFVFVLAVGIISSRRSKGDSVSGYFLASRNMHWIPVGASLFASNIGSGHFIGLAGSGAASGIGIGAFELNADLYAGALFIQESIGQTSEEWLYISVLILLAIAAIFTTAGGLSAVMWTDFVQTILMIVGALILMVISLHRVGGYGNMVEDYFYAVAYNVSEKYENCAKPPYYAMNFIRPIAPGESDLPWTGMLFGISISSIWYWCTDQVIVQRVLASKNMIHAKAGCVLAAWLKFLPVLLLVFPGMCARILFPNEVGCVEPAECKRICGSEIGCTNIAYIKLVLELLPVGLRGLMLAVMMAALMSSLTSIFNSSSTIFSIDIWERIRRNGWKEMNSRMIEIEKLIVGRAFVLILVIVSVIWIPVLQSFSSSQLFIYIESVSAFFAPPVSAVYGLAIFWKRTNEPGAFWGLMVGMIFGIIRLIMEFAYVVPPCGSDIEDPRPKVIKVLVGQVHFLHFGCLLFLITLVVAVSVSLATEPIPDKCLHRLTFETRFSDKPRMSVREWRNETEENILETTNKRKRNENEKSQETYATQSVAWQVLYKVCGFGSAKNQPLESQDQDKSPEEIAREAAEFLKEDAHQARTVNGFARLALVAATFMWGFYS